ncbi:MAG: SprT family zinc-dependent metalloprotease [Burkholderiaceae bacterium]|nr:SprT family zinc-dependent metalloprotease [Burkholderiaceae bacterium]
MARLTPPPATQLELFGFDAPAAPPASPAGQKRHILLDGQTITYALRRSKRRSIGFQIDHDGLRITAPKWVTLTDIEQAIGTKLRWIVSKLDEQATRAAQPPTPPIEWRDGATLPYLGQPIILRLQRTQKASITLDHESRELTLGLNRDATEAQLRSRILKWLQQQATDIFAARLSHYAGKLGVSYTAFGLSGATTRWGSCNADGMIRLNWRLIHLTEQLIDYVVAHELAHLREMNHSARFWATVESVYPDYHAARLALREQAMIALPII